MTDVDLIEDRLRRAFRAMAEDPVTSMGTDTEPTSARGLPPSRRRLTLAVGVVAALVVVGLGLALAFGPRSSSPAGGHSTPVASQPATADSAQFDLVYSTGSPTTPTVLHQVASILANRLGHLGATDIKATVVGPDVHLSGKAPEGAVETDVRVLGETQAVSLRPVECGARPYTPAVDVAAPATNSPLPACGAQYETNRANLAVTPDRHVPAGYTDRTVPPDPAFTAYPSTRPSLADSASSSTVLLPAAPDTGEHDYARYVLGPTELTGADIAGARALRVDGHWVVDITFTPAGADEWNAVAHESFHQMISVDLDGAVVSAPLVQPRQEVFSSPEGRFQLPGTYTAQQARTFASIFGNEAIPVPLVLESQTIVGPGLLHGSHG